MARRQVMTLEEGRLPLRRRRLRGRRRRTKSSWSIAIARSAARPAICTCSWPARRFRLLSGADKLTTYTFNTSAAKHLSSARSAGSNRSMCRARIPTATASISAACDAECDFTSVLTAEFDGSMWEQNAAKLAPLESELVSTKSSCPRCRPPWKKASSPNGWSRKATRSSPATSWPRSKPTRRRWNSKRSTRARSASCWCPKAPKA